MSLDKLKELKSRENNYSETVPEQLRLSWEGIEIKIEESKPALLRGMSAHPQSFSNLRNWLQNNLEERPEISYDLADIIIFSRSVAYKPDKVKLAIAGYISHLIENLATQQQKYLNMCVNEINLPGLFYNTAYINSLEIRNSDIDYLSNHLKGIAYPPNRKSKKPKVLISYDIKGDELFSHASAEIIAVDTVEGKGPCNKSNANCHILRNIISDNVSFGEFKSKLAILENIELRKEMYSRPHKIESDIVILRNYTGPLTILINADIVIAENSQFYFNKNPKQKTASLEKYDSGSGLMVCTLLPNPILGIHGYEKESQHYLTDSSAEKLKNDIYESYKIPHILELLDNKAPAKDIYNWYKSNKEKWA